MLLRSFVDIMVMVFLSNDVKKIEDNDSTFVMSQCYVVIQK